MKREWSFRKSLTGWCVAMGAMAAAKASGFAGPSPDGFIIFVLVYGGFFLGRVIPD